MPEAVGERSEERPTAATGPSARAVSRLRAVARSAALFAAAVGVLVLVGWLLDFRPFLQVLSGQVAMVPNAAIAFILAGLALWWQAGIETRSSLYASGAAAAACVLLGLLALAEYFSGLRFGIDELLFRDRASMTGAFPGRMAVITAISFVAIGSALLLSNLGRVRWPAEVLALVPGLLALISLAGYASGMRSIYWIGNYKRMAIHTAATFLVLSLGVLLSRGDSGFARLMVSDTERGTVARRILPVALGVPLVLGWLQGLYRTRYGAVFFAVSNAVVLLAIFWGIAAVLMRTDQERKRAQEALRASEQRIRAVMEGATDALVVATTDGIVLEINGAAEALYGRPRTEVVGRHFLTTLAPEEHVSVRERFEGDVVRGRAQGRESVVLRADGKRIPIEVSVSRVEIGREQLMFAIIRDITDRKRAEDAVRDAERQLRRVLDALPLMVAVLAPDGTVLDGNRLPLRVFGLPLGKALGRPFGDLYPWASSPAVQARLREALQRAARGEIVRYDEELPTSSGRSVVLDVSITPIKDEAGRVTHLIPSGLDITERKRAEQALAESEDHYRDLVEHSQSLICTHDLEGRILSINNWAARALGRTHEELLAMRVQDILAPEVRHEFEDYIARIRRDGVAIGFMLVETRAGEKLIWEYHNTLRTEGVAAPIVRGMARDVTERRRTEEELKGSRERLRMLSRRLIEAHEEERRRIARGLHDEIGQELTALKINLQAAGHAGNAEAVSRLVDSLEIVERTTKQVRNLSLALRPSLLDDLGLVAALRWHADGEAKRAGFTLDFVAEPADIRPAPEIGIACYRVVQEALTNVARHARARHVRVELAAADGWLDLRVRDDGVGFDVRAAQDRATRGASFGLLSMTERARLLDSRLEIDSAPGRGTEVRVRIPLSAKEP